MNENKRYLVVYPTNSGYAELCNVGITEASSEKEAKELFGKQVGMASDYWHELESYVLDELPDGWTYFV